MIENYDLRTEQYIRDPLMPLGGRGGRFGQTMPHRNTSRVFERLTSDLGDVILIPGGYSRNCDFRAESGAMGTANNRKGVRK